MADDPINPKHYSGTLCAEIGERLSANSYQVLKYNWRLGKKDAATIELGKSLWYLERELELSRSGWRPQVILPDSNWFFVRYKEMDFHVQAVCVDLINWNRFHDTYCLQMLRTELVDKLASLQESGK